MAHCLNKTCCVLLYLINPPIPLFIEKERVLHIDPTHYCLTLEDFKSPDTSSTFFEGKLNARNLLITHKNELLLTVLHFYELL